MEDRLHRNLRYFETEAGDFDAIETDPSKVSDPFRRFVYKYFIKLHKHNPREQATLQLARRCFPNLHELQVLELGCGHGRSSIMFARLGACCTMVDFSQKMLTIARRNCDDAQLENPPTFVHANILEFNPGRRFDLVFLTGVTDYLPKTVLHQLGRVLARVVAGKAIVSFPDYSLFNGMRKIWLSGFKRVFVNFYRLREIQGWAALHQLEILQINRIRGYYVVLLHSRAE